MNKLQTAAVVALSLLAVPSSFPTFIDKSDLETLAAQARQDADAPALGLVVIRNGVEPELAVDGVRIFGNDAVVTSKDKWHWGSITKSMTATLVARLVEKDIISWDDTIDAHLGKSVPQMQDAYRDVTFRHLLMHRGGLAANIPIKRFAEFGQAPEDPISDRLKWVRIALSQSPIGPKETKYAYSNNGYIVVGAMLEAATGESWESLIKREVFTPLKLTGAGFGAPNGKQPFDQPRGHQKVSDVDKAVPLNVDNPAALGPAGRVHMPLADMARYLLVHASQRTDFLSPESYNILHTASLGGNYAMGWVVTKPEKRWHNGSNTMWYAEVAFNLAEGTAAAVVVNDGDRASVQTAVRELLRKLMEKQKKEAEGD
ncbi:MAG: beta-lactamase family protein [Planctomycetes bacterium]|nr:beta-lactamase family protein [Planctomycetota bacterium]